MPISPRFSITQDDEFVTVKIHVPYVRVGAMEFVVDGTDFSFWCKPYLLRLAFPCPLVDDDRAGATYNHDEEHGTLYVRVPKATPGEHFPDLDFISKMLAPSATAVTHRSHQKPGIEVVGSTAADAASAAEESEGEEDELPPTYAEAASALPGTTRYGFNRQYSGVFADLTDELDEVLECPQPEHLPVEVRHVLRAHVELANFDPDRYASDFAGAEEDYVFTEALRMAPHWLQQPSPAGASDSTSAAAEASTAAEAGAAVEAGAGEEAKADGVADALSRLSLNSGSRGSSEAEGTHLSEEERAELMQMPKRRLELPVNDAAFRRLVLGLADVLAAYAYDHRTTQGDPSVESAWTVAILAATLSWLDEFEDAGDCVRTSLRRMLVYPYLRSVHLATLCWRDVCAILRRGRACALKCMVGVRRILARSEHRYLLNRVVVDDYCLWLQSLPAGALLVRPFPVHVLPSLTRARLPLRALPPAVLLQAIAEELEAVVAGLDRADLGLFLPEIEAAVLDGDAEALERVTAALSASVAGGVGGTAEADEGDAGGAGGGGSARPSIQVLSHTPAAGAASDDEESEDETESDAARR